MIKKLVRNNRIVFIDVETTGLDPKKGHRIIEIGAIAMADNYIIDEFQSLIRVNRTIPRHVSKIHGITDEMLTDQPGPEDVFPYIKDFISGSILVAHNAEFDLAFLRSEFHKLNLSINNQVFCTLKMSRRRYPRLPNYKLSTVYRHLVGNHPADARKHRALDDARMVAAIWLAMEGK
jgi:DNA polymerase-3 subunit epsilon